MKSSLKSIFVGLLPFLPLSVALFITYLPVSYIGLENKLFTYSFIASLLLATFCVYPLGLGLLSIPFHKYIVKGRYPRDLSNRIYFGRACYGRLWTSFFYSGPIYQVVLGIPPLRNIVLRLFGMKGEMKFTIFPDAWIRDLPILRLGNGVYIANKSTIGTNLCLKDNITMVEGINIGKLAMIGHMSAIGPGTSIEDSSELGVTAIVGIRVKVGARASVGAMVGLNHGCKIGNRATVGTRAFIGVRSVIGENVVIPPCTVVPDGEVVYSSEDLERISANSSKAINRAVDDIQDSLQKISGLSKGRGKD